ncbi:Type I restriction-modification system, restriction subunit R [Methanosarcina barkeri 3]|uniref:Type I restriction-modification system, restriction subunit R n=1 Tax=Methanosarcina barkeri 3 TaxID=1434107 RepID=A0A0E3WXM6_METBA|nr:Type I restriction-modification system, restriction subunit R [Methanosarcina barkeri 3]
MNSGKNVTEEATLKWSELKNSLQEADQKELINLLHDLYKDSADNHRFITARYAKKEDERAIMENLTEEELSLFDKLKKPDLTEKEKSQVKKVTKELLSKLKAEKLVLDWRKKQQAMAAVKKEIEDELDKGLPESYNPKAYEEKCDIVFQHIYDSYVGDNHSIYEATA